MVASKKHSSGKGNIVTRSAKNMVSNVQEYGESLVGSRIRVWWPIDRKFYEGVVDSFDSSRKKHRVLYDDGDQENLDMKKERWELIKDDDVKPDEDESTDEGSDATPEPHNRKRERNGKLSVRVRKDDGVPKKKQKIVSSSKRAGVTIAEKRKNDEKQTPKSETGINGNMGDVGGKIVAAASRMSGRFRNKENGQEKEKPKPLKTRKKISASKNLRQKRPSSSSEAVSDKVSKPKRSSKKTKSSNTDDEDGEDDDDVETSDDDSKPLVSFLKKSPKAIEALMRKLKAKKEKEAGEGSSGSEAEVEDEAEDEDEAEEEAEEAAEEEAEEEAEEAAEEEAEEEAESEAEEEAESEAEEEAESEAEEDS